MPLTEGAKGSVQEEKGHLMYEWHGLRIHPYFLFSDMLLKHVPFLAQPGLLSAKSVQYTIHGLVPNEVN